MSRYVIHDLHLQDTQLISDLFPNSVIINANKNYARCKGCFGCWLKTPSKCVFNDSMEYLGCNILQSEEIVIISKCVYGGFSTQVKRLWDRCIGGVTPFFQKRNGQLHHLARYQNNPKLRVFFYNAQQLLDTEKEVAQNLVKANAINFMSKDYKTYFLNNIDELGGVLQ